MISHVGQFRCQLVIVEMRLIKVNMIIIPYIYIYVFLDNSNVFRNFISRETTSV